MKNKRRNNSEIPSTMTWNNLSAVTGNDISNLFASYFESAYSQTILHQRHFSDSISVESNSTLNNFHIDIVDVYKSLLSLDTKNGARLLNIFLKNCTGSLCVPLTHIFCAPI